MYWPFLVSIAVALCIGVPSMFMIRDKHVSVLNATAIALVISWSIGMAWWLATRKGVPLQIDIIRDYFVLIVIFIKVGDQDRAPTPGALGWARDWWFQLSWWDKAVCVLFVPMWFTYAVEMDPYYSYWISWTAGKLQFLAAGGEAVERWRRGRVRAETDDPTDLSMRRLGLVGHGC